MAIELLYDRGTLAVAPPPGCVPTVIHKHAMPVLPDPVAAIEQALAQPVDAPPLRRAGRDRRSRLHPDLRHHAAGAQRPVPAAHDPHAARGRACRRTRITVLVATGLHRPNEGEELAELVGDPWVLETVRVENHFARDERPCRSRRARRRAARRSGSTGASSRPTCGSRPAWSSRISWPAGRAAAR